MNKTLNEIAERLQGKMYGDYGAFICPFHSDNTPSFLVNEETYRCLACGAYGLTKNLLKKLDHTSIPKQEYTVYSPKWNSWLSDNSIPEFAIEAHNSLMRFSEMKTYLKNRKLLPSIKPLKIGWMDGTFFFPIFDKNKRIIGIVARNGDGNYEATQQRYFTPPGQSGMLYVPDWASLKSGIGSPPRLFVVYGIVDAISMRLAGLPALTWSIGKNLPAEALEEFRCNITVIPDRDEEETGCKLVASLGWRGKLKCLAYPDDCKDPADIYQKYGGRVLTRLIE